MVDSLKALDPERPIREADWCWQIPVRGDDGARAVGASDDDDDVGFAWSGRWRRRDLRGRSINDGKFSSTDMVESGAAHFGFGGAMLLDLPGPALRLLTDVHFSDIAVRGDDGARAIGANDDAAAVELRGRRRQPACMKRSCQRHTQVFDLPVRRMISLVPTPSALNRTISARQTCLCGVLRSRVSTFRCGDRRA
jgi:hypothetical protein